MLSWNVFRENINTKQIEIYDIFEGGYFEKVAKEIKNIANNKIDFADEFRTSLMSQFWCRSEYEVVITSWPPRINADEFNKINYEQAEYYNRYKVYPYSYVVNPTVAEKIDIFNQIELNWEHFIDYVWGNI